MTSESAQSNDALSGEVAAASERINVGQDRSGHQLALARFDGDLFLAFISMQMTSCLLTTSSPDGINCWAGASQVPGVFTHCGPAFAAFAGDLVLAYPTPNFMVTVSSGDGVAWTREKRVTLGVGASRMTPALAAFKGRLALVYVSDKGELRITSSADCSEWSIDQTVGERYAPKGVALTPCGGRLIVAYVAGDGVLRVTSSSDGISWSDDQRLGSQSVTAPALTANGGKLVLAYSDANAALWTRSSTDGVTWSDARPVKGHYSRLTPALIAFEGKLVLAYVSSESTQIGSMHAITSSDGVNWSGRTFRRRRRPERSMTLIRAEVFHTTDNPWTHPAALECFRDGAVAFENGQIVATGEFADVWERHPDAEVIDERGAILLPGLVDTHVHYPQLPVIGAMGLQLLAWLRERTLPEEMRFDNAEYARDAARVFVRALAANGTTSALVFGSHFPAAQQELFAAAADAGLRIASGLVVSDRDTVPPKLRIDPEAALRESRHLIYDWHRTGLLRYAVTPRFAYSCTDQMLAACGTLMKEVPDLLFTTHINENTEEIAEVRTFFPKARDYLDTYDRHGLIGALSVLAHNVHPTAAEVERLAGAEATIAHCPSSNAFLGSGIFPMLQHRIGGVRVALGTDVGAGTGLSMLKECLAAYEMQALLPTGDDLTPAQLLYLATKAGAEALGLGETVGDLMPGMGADLVLLRPPRLSTLAHVLAHNELPEARLGAIFTLAREECVAEVRVEGKVVFRAGRGRYVAALPGAVSADQTSARTSPAL